MKILEVKSKHTGEVVWYQREIPGYSIGWADLVRLGFNITDLEFTIKEEQHEKENS